jgi:glycosyltransferase involved in cell wall biosynthesis
MPKLSIITINLNNRSGLEKTIHSVREQTFSDYEFLIVDGGSQDGSQQLLESARHFFAYAVSEPDRGIYHAQNKGILAAQGEYCLFLNSGDTLVDAHVLSDVFPAGAPAPHNEDILYGDMRAYYKPGDIRETQMPETISFEHMMMSTILHPVSFIKRTLLLENGLYNENYKIAADYDFFFKAVLVKMASLRHLNRTIACFDMSGISSDPKNLQTILLEREAIQRSHLHPSILELFQAYVSLRKNPLLRFFRKMKKVFR